MYPQTFLKHEPGFQVLMLCSIIHSDACHTEVRAPVSYPGGVGRTNGPPQGWEEHRTEGEVRGGSPLPLAYSHSMVAGGLSVTSYRTRVTFPESSRVIRSAILRRTSGGTGRAVAVIASSDSTMRTETASP